jgi:hypothetical protein
VAYLFDTNVLIQAKNLHYGFEFCPAFWQWLVENGAQQKVRSITQVKDEILGGEDELEAWVKSDGADLFESVDEKTSEQFPWLSEWVNTSEQYDPAAKVTFQQVADYYLVAHARAHNHTIVTHEKPENSRKRVKIPNACVAASVEFITPYSMLKRERARFVLGKLESGGTA